ncbi:dienelactone hydrolase family protein [Cohnella fermenti]|uniref:Dienelactone hydrolase domain-containing protein n=1 Tax=Cohnella fermenti TaxID=2565925 RepID=A0A4S4BWW7_9BACL|nr:dienelactone hydrolase family protein [Cohnella fermenti]THF79133.1 hypothetical protein E6C55_13035 [Cohnella fermenti]
MGNDRTGERLYREPAGAANERRERQFLQLEQYVRLAREEADRRRERFYRPDLHSPSAFERSNHSYRERFIRMLGWPLATYSDTATVPEADIEFVGEDELSRIYRLDIRVDSRLSLYGLLFLPLTEGPHPLVIVQHGGGGTPELCAAFYESSNYNDMPRRCLRRGLAVFAPQLHLWTPEQGPEKKRKEFDHQLKQLGGSIAALEIYKLRRSLDYMQARSDIDGGRIGICGLSYGGFYALFTAAADTRIRAVYTSCFFNDRFRYDWSDWIWQDSGNLFLDAEVAGLVCPRPLYIEVGSEDELFEADSAAREFRKIERLYAQLRLPYRLQFKVFDGKHEFDPADDGLRFLEDALAGRLE